MYVLPDFFFINKSYLFQFNLFQNNNIFFLNFLRYHKRKKILYSCTLSFSFMFFFLSWSSFPIIYYDYHFFPLFFYFFILPKIFFQKENDYFPPAHKNNPKHLRLSLPLIFRSMFIEGFWIESCTDIITGSHSRNEVHYIRVHKEMHRTSSFDPIHE